MLYLIRKWSGVRLNAAPTDLRETSAYSVVGVEVWGYGVSNVVEIAKAAALDASPVKVVGLDEYLACVVQLALAPAAAEVERYAGSALAARMSEEGSHLFERTREVLA